MVTQVSQATKDSVTELKAEIERLKLNQRTQDVKQGQIFLGKPADGANDRVVYVKLFVVDERTEYPVKNGKTYIGTDKKEHPEYKVAKFLWTSEADLYQLVSGEKKSANLYFTKRR